MICLLDELVRDVRIALDRNRTAYALIDNSDEETLQLDDIIRSKLPQAVEHVHLAAPIHLLQTGHNFDTVIYWHDNASGHILLPRNFLRLVVFQMSDWPMAVNSLLPTSSPLYARCHSPIKALRGTTQRPLCFLTVRPEGNALEFYSCSDTSATATKAVYLPTPHVETYGNNTGIFISPNLRTAVVLTTASFVALTLGLGDLASLLAAQAKQAMQIPTNQ